MFNDWISETINYNLQKKDKITLLERYLFLCFINHNWHHDVDDTDCTSQVIF